MFRFFYVLYRHRQYTVFGLAMIISVLLLTASPPRQVSITRMVWLTVLTPFQEAFAFIPSYFNLKSENQLLRQKLVQMQLQAVDLEERRFENQRLRGLLSLKDRKQYTYIPAEVIGWNTDQGLNTMVIDVGRSDQVRKYMAVVMEDGVLGRIIEVGRTSSFVQLLTDRNCRISGLVQRSREQGIIRYRSNGLYMQLPLRCDVRLGDRVVTSGLGETFPSGLPVGRISQIALGSRNLFKRVSIIPAVDLNRLEEVFVIVGEETPVAVDSLLVQ
ncbi:MAG: rod shape-determining protein MreC [Gemmatimonadetes bacterium]|nr:rod shape-determining protein MreC [Gemmatimonadota bacterium]